MATLEKERSTSQILATVMLIVWLVLLVPWFMYAPLAGLAFDGGVTLSVTVGVWSLWTYPLTVIVAAALKKISPAFILLPFLNGLGIFIARFL